MFYLHDLGSDTSAYQHQHSSSSKWCGNINVIAFLMYDYG